ncbi:MAG: hypothetical protein ACR5KV_04405 [Wolbachia sp.]
MQSELFSFLTLALSEQIYSPFPIVTNYFIQKHKSQSNNAAIAIIRELGVLISTKDVSNVRLAKELAIK